jgi:hypothetical protein
MNKFIPGMLILMMALLTKSYSQSIFTQQTGRVVFSSVSGNSLIGIKEGAARLCNRYINKYYPKKKLPLIYLSIVNDSTTADTAYQLSYDNLYGNSLENEYTDRRGKYYKPGIRIRIVNASLDTVSLFKLLDYGINHLVELKALHAKAIKEEISTNTSLALSPQKIKQILSAATSDKIKNTLRE